MKLVSISTMVERRTAIGIFAALVLAVGPQAFAQTDPAVGTWKLNLAKSKFTPGPAPKSQTIIVEAMGQGMLRASVGGVDAQGRPTKGLFVLGFDGKPYPVTGNPAFDAASYKRIDAQKTEFTRTKAGKLIQTGTNVMSADGRTLTVTANGVNANGQQVNNVAVFEKQ
jgi:hypothetical protein